MSINNLFWGDTISPGSQPALIFPITSNQVLGNINLDVELNSTINSQSGTLNQETGQITLDGTTDSESGTAIGSIGNVAGHFGFIGHISDRPETGLLANLAIGVSINGANFVPGLGILSELTGSGFYKYIPDPTETQDAPTPDSSNHGALLIHVYPLDPLAIANRYIQETCIYVRVKAPGPQLVKLSPAQDQTISDIFTPITEDLKAYIQQALRDLLGNQMVLKPTLRRD